MHEHFRRELKLLLLSAALGVPVGWALGGWSLGLVVALAGLSARRLWRLWRFERWLDGVEGQRGRLRGIWDLAANRIERTQRQARRRKKRLGRLLHRFRDTLEALPDGAAILDSEYRFVWTNAAARRLLGLAQGDTPVPLTRLLLGKGVRGWLAEVPFERPLQLVIDGPPRRELRLRLLPFEENQFLLTVHDITEQQRVQAVRRDFIANVSHELRTPLTVIMGYLEMLDEDRLPDQVKEAVAASLRQARRMERLVSDLLMLSRLELADRPPANEPVAVPALLEGLARDAGDLCERHGDHPLETRLAAGLGLLGSESELTSAFGNLLFNAIIHTPPGTAVTLIWEETKEGGARLVVADTGPGIPRRHLHRLTERFYRVDKSRSRERGGTGLGLAIVNHVLQRHQARIEIDSKPGGGSRFICLFPPGRVVKLQAFQETIQKAGTSR